MSVIYGPYAANMGYHVVNIGESVVYTGFARIAWGIGIAYIIISCAQGQAGKQISVDIQQEIQSQLRGQVSIIQSIGQLLAEIVGM